ncbi:hypothetical protein CI1B_53330 [Bradyrhizobium ivorense]|uniref:Uncharacterized protein n=1 Tax=Bradyrhizobium ivorense TaxID=2511166 RepID=A0A508TJM6_9BRAD|nr:hypothetical protein [Bradyrhizobium ivorense]VIO74560.1 hypothetical protein CI1B_53330 [Bradyrhizobium ivorense]
MGEIIRFIPKAERERARLIREARANYERIFPSGGSGQAETGTSGSNADQVSSEP